MHFDAPLALHDGSIGRDAPTDIALVQDAYGFAASWNNSGSTIVASFASPLAVGDDLAIYITYADSGTIKTIADDAGNQYTKLDDIDDGDNSQKSATAYGVVVTPEATQLTVTFDNGPCCRVVIAHELRGVDTTTPIDGHSFNQDDSEKATPNGVVATSSNSMMTTTIDRDYIFAATSNSNNSNNEVISAGTGMQLVADPPVGNGNPTASEDSIQVTHGPTVSTFTYSQNGAGLTMQMAFRP